MVNKSTIKEKEKLTKNEPTAGRIGCSLKQQAKLHKRNKLSTQDYADIGRHFMDTLSKYFDESRGNANFVDRSKVLSQSLGIDSSTLYVRDQLFHARICALWFARGQRLGVLFEELLSKPEKSVIERAMRTKSQKNFDETSQYPVHYAIEGWFAAATRKATRYWPQPIQADFFDAFCAYESKSRKRAEKIAESINRKRSINPILKLLA